MSQTLTNSGGASPGRRVIFWIILLLALSMSWISATDHALYSPDEGRYGSVSAHMAEGGGWLVPVFRGRPHLTKPPLTYWAEALLIRALGRTELAVRGPSLLAGSATLLITFALGCRIGGRRVGLVAAAILASMPIHAIMSRLATTDPPLSFFWTSALACSYMAIKTSRKRWALLLWIAVAFGLMTKGPLALAPVGVTLVWLALARKWREMRRLHILAGAPLAMAPVLIWAGMVIHTHPEAVTIWRQEMLDRAVGTGDHPEPLWYYLPIFFGGLFPATAMLIVPGWNMPWRRAWAMLRAGDDASLWALAVVLPYILFTLITGKLSSYLLPLAPPLALLTAMMLERWFTGEADDRKQGFRPPEVVATLTICLGLTTIAFAVAMRMFLEDVQLWKVTPFAITTLAGAWAWSIWRRRPAWRAGALALVWALWIGSWVWGWEVEDDVVRPANLKQAVEAAKQMAPSGTPELATYGFYDAALDFYYGDEPPQLFKPDAVRALLADASPDLVLFADGNAWARLVESSPELAASFEVVARRRRRVVREMLLLRPIADVVKTNRADRAEEKVDAEKPTPRPSD